MYMAASFGSKELNLPGPKLIMTVLIINAVAIAGAYFFAWYSKKYNNKASLLFMLVIWVGDMYICLLCIYPIISFISLHLL